MGGHGKMLTSAKRNTCFASLANLIYNAGGMMSESGSEVKPPVHSAGYGRVHG
jgi:hypothetical protein